jgi:hypothetical protein
MNTGVRKLLGSKVKSGAEQIVVKRVSRLGIDRNTYSFYANDNRKPSWERSAHEGTDNHTVGHHYRASLAHSDPDREDAGPPRCGADYQVPHHLHGLPP